jgi:hypothetical protein
VGGCLAGFSHQPLVNLAHRERLDLASHGVGREEGVLITGVEPWAAGDCGLRAGDVLLAVDGAFCSNSQGGAKGGMARLGFVGRAWTDNHRAMMMTLQAWRWIRRVVCRCPSGATPSCSSPKSSIPSDPTPTRT